MDYQIYAMCEINIILVLINDILGDFFKPQRGLIQGDHLSPYLFVLCAEGLSSLIYQDEQMNLLMGLKVC